MAVDPGTLNSFDLNDTTPITTNTGAVVLTLTAESLSPQGSVGGTPTVSSSDTSIATVSASAFVLNSDSTAVISDITITGVAIGTSTITVSFTDPGTVAHSVTATVTVEAPDYLDQSGLRHFWDKIKSLFIKNENGAVTTDLLANSAVTTAKINASAITNAKLATAAVQTTNILDGAVTSDKIDWTTFGIVNYSTNEATTGATWVNGSQIFKRSYYISAGPAAGGTTTISFGSSVTLVIRAEGYLSNGINEFPIPAARNTVDTQIGMFVSLQDHNVVLESNFDRTGYSGYITLFYIKN